MTKTIDAQGLDFMALNRQIRAAGEGALSIQNCQGQRFVGAGLSGRDIEISGVPGNALGCYLSGSRIVVRGNAQDQVGDTMDRGEITIHGDAGDCAGYAMRGGVIYVKGSSGYRTGIHMKAYEDNVPVIVIGGRAGSFLGEYQAGGIIVVLGLYGQGDLAGSFCAVGQHGGRIYLRTANAGLPESDKLNVTLATPEDLALIRPYLDGYAERFGGDGADLAASEFTLITPNTKNPYKTLYTYS